MNIYHYLVVGATLEQVRIAATAPARYVSKYIDAYFAAIEMAGEQIWAEMRSH